VDLYEAGKYGETSLAIYMAIPPGAKIRTAWTFVSFGRCGFEFEQSGSSIFFQGYPSFQ
jgi:hypothetical protein